MRSLVSGPVGPSAPTDRSDQLSVDQVADVYAYPGSQTWVRANMVTSLDGAATVRGLSAPLSTSGDRWLFHLLRALCDVVVVGAGTVRAEDYQVPATKPEFAHLREGRPTAPRLAIVTGTGDLDAGLRVFSGPQKPLLITHEQTAGRLGHLGDVGEVVACGQESVDVDAAVSALTAREGPRVLLEGGPSLLGSFAEADHVDEIALTWSPNLAGGDAGRIVSGSALGPSRMELHSLLADDDGGLFARYVRSR